jgi:hypothetical protein
MICRAWSHKVSGRSVSWVGSQHHGHVGGFLIDLHTVDLGSLHWWVRAVVASVRIRWGRAFGASMVAKVEAAGHEAVTTVDAGRAGKRRWP